MNRLLCIALLLLAAPAIGAEELFRDGFEGPPDKAWQHTWGPWAISADRAHEGKRSLKETLEDQYGYSVHYRDAAAERGARYTFSAWVFIPSAQPKRPVARLSINTTRWAGLAAAHTAKLDQWVQLTARYVNVGQRTLRFELMQARQQAGLGGAVMFWDSVACTIERGAVAVPQHPNPAVLEGLGIAPADGLSVRVDAGACAVGRHEVAVARAATFRLDPPTVRGVQNERHKLSPDAPGGWAKGTRLRQLIGAGVTLPASRPRRCAATTARPSRRRGASAPR